MKFSLKMAGVGALLTAGVFVFGGAQEKQEELVVHEWGVIQMDWGGKAALLKALPGKPEELPSFVQKPKPQQLLQHDIGCGAGKGKPIIYFYPSTAMSKVNVSVSELKGWITSFAPSGVDEGTDQTKNLHWQNLSLSPELPDNKELPKVAERHWWAKARETDSAYVTTSSGACEKFLFYEGVGPYKPPLDFNLTGKGELTVQAVGQTRSPLWLVSVSKDKKVSAEVIEKGKSGEKVETKLASWKELKDPVGKLAKVLREAGLYEKEARGMAEVWQKDFFETEGIRVLYLLTQKEYDELLPLTITPKPTEIKRVMIVQVEFPTVEKVQELEKEMKKLVEDLASGERPRQAEAASKLIKMGEMVRSAVEKLLREKGQSSESIKFYCEEVLKGLGNKVSKESDKHEIAEQDKQWIKEGICNNPDVSAHTIKMTDATYWDCPSCKKNTRGVRLGGDKSLCKECAKELGVCPLCGRRVK